MKQSLVVLLSLLLLSSPFHLVVLAEEPVPDEETVQEEFSELEPLPEPEAEESLPEPEPEPDPLPDPEVEMPHIFINEILADPKEKDAENEFIELYNAGDELVDISAWQLDDARADDGVYTLPDGTFLEPGQYLLLFRPETGITLNNDVDLVMLLDSEGNQVDYHEFASQGSGRSWGRNPDNSEEWLVFKNPTPGEQNVIEPNAIPVAVIEVQKDTRHMKLNVTGEASYDPDGDKLTFMWTFEEGFYDERENPLKYEYQEPGNKIVRLRVTDQFGDFSEAELTFEAALKGSGSPELEVFPIFDLINEVMPSPEGKDSENEWVEFYNDNSFGIDLSGWYIDDAEGKSSPYKIPEGTVILPFSYMVFSEPGLGLSFKNSEDVVRILDPNKNINQEVEYFEAKENWTYARKSYGEYEWTSILTPGEPNDFLPPPKAYNPGDLTFESVLPNPEGEDSGNEVVVLTNKSSEDVSLFGWLMADASGAEKSLPDLIVTADEKLTLYSSEFGLSLNNSDESLSLFDPVGNLIDEIKWKKSASGRWLLNPDALHDGMEAEVIRIVDGDTFLIHFEGKKLTVRMLGIDTPETVHPFKPVEYFGKQASNFLSEKLTGQWVRLEFDENKIDKYGRVLAYVYVFDEMINQTIVSEGFGYAYTRFPFRFLDEFVILEQQAQEAGLGLWENQKVRSLIEKIVDEELLLEDEIPDEDLLLLLEEESVETEQELIVEEEILEAEVLEEVIEIPTCPSEFLKIDRFLPNPQKGEQTEFIRLINTGSEQVCLYGWVLDDVIEKGSKPFVISGGAIAPGGVRTFRKQETGLALNNSNDCVNLIGPNGDLADQICYEKTHKNEIFTHAGGDWKPKPRAKRKSRSTQKTSRHSFKRSLVSYQSELSTSNYIGKVAQVDELAKSMLIVLEGDQMLDISYANSPIDISITRQLIDFSQPVQIQVYEAEGFRNLLSIHPIEHSGSALQQEDKTQDSWLILLLGLVLLSSLPLMNKVCPSLVQILRRD